MWLTKKGAVISQSLSHDCSNQAAAAQFLGNRGCSQTTAKCFVTTALVKVQLVSLQTLLLNRMHSNVSSLDTTVCRQWTKHPQLESYSHPQKTLVYSVAHELYICFDESTRCATDVWIINGKSVCSQGLDIRSCGFNTNIIQNYEAMWHFPTDWSEY